MKRHMGIINIIIYFSFQFIVGAALAILLMMVHPDMSRSVLENKLYSIQFMGVIISGALLIILIFNFRVIKEKIKYSLSHLSQTIAYGLGGYGVVIFSIIALNLILTIAGIKQVDAENEEAVQRVIDSAPLFSSFLVIGVLGPFLEELVFRTSFMALFTKDEPSKSFIPYILGALLFTFIHDYTIITAFSAASVATFLTYFIPAIILSFIYRFSNHNLLAVFIVHFLNNSLPFILIAMGVTQ